MSVNVQDLLALVREGDVDACERWFQGMPEAQRRELGPQLLAVVRAIRDQAWVQEGHTFSLSAASWCAQVLMLCTATLAELKSVHVFSLPRDDRAYRILVDRDPPWLNEWAAHLLDQERYWFWWTVVRALLRDGRIQRPSSSNYILAMVGGMPTPVIDALRADPELLDHEVWELFEHEGAGENSLANVDRWGGEGWGDALLVLMNEGRLDRQRLLDGCLAALQRDFNHYRARWFTKFFDRLEPTASELEARAEPLLALLRMSAAPVVSWAFTKVDKLARSGGYSPDALVTALEPVMTARAKGLVKKALKLLTRLAKSSAVHAKVAQCAIQALTHEAQDVQELALDLVEKVGSPEDAALVTQLDGYRMLVAPTLKPRLEAWIGVEAEATAPVELPDASHLSEAQRALFAVDDLLEQPSASGWTLPAARFDGTDIARLNGPAVPPVAHLDELLELIAQGLEDNLSPLDLERTFDGIARFVGERPADFERRLGPAEKRAQKVLEREAPFLGGGPSVDLAGLVLAWLAGSAPTTHMEQRTHYERSVVVLDGHEYGRTVVPSATTSHFLNTRGLQLAQQVGAGTAQPLFALPTHEGGFIDPRVVAERAVAWSGPEPRTIEVVLALLRLAPEHRAEALSTLPSAGPEWLSALRYALGGSERIGESAALWIAACRARAPWHTDPAVLERFPHAGPDAGEVATYGSLEPSERHGLHFTGPTPAPEEHVASGCLPQLFHADRSGPAWGHGNVGALPESSIRWLATMWPTAREAHFAGAIIALGTNLDWWEAAWQHKALLDPLLDPNTPLRDMGLLLLAVGLAAKEPGEHLLAIDATILAIEDGRLGSDTLGRVLRDLLTKPFVKLGRYAKTLTLVSETSDAHAAVVFLALSRALPAVLVAPPRDTGKLLDLLEQLGVRLDAGVSEECREALTALKGSAKTRKTAARIAAHTPGWSTGMQSATALLAEMRVQRASEAEVLG